MRECSAAYDFPGGFTWKQQKLLYFHVQHDWSQLSSVLFFVLRTKFIQATLVCCHNDPALSSRSSQLSNLEFRIIKGGWLTADGQCGEWYVVERMTHGCVHNECNEALNIRACRNCLGVDRMRTATLQLTCFQALIDTFFHTVWNEKRNFSDHSAFRGECQMSAVQMMKSCCLAHKFSLDQYEWVFKMNYSPCHSNFGSLDVCSTYLPGNHMVHFRPSQRTVNPDTP